MKLAARGGGRPPKGVARWRLRFGYAQTARGTLVKVQCKHNRDARRQGGCPGCMARYWMATREVFELLCNRKVAAALLLLRDLDRAQLKEGP